MRKYQQLALILCSGLFLIILLVYKSENSRLKDVLNVVNFFGRNVTEARPENSLDDELYSFLPTLPIPVWQVLGTASSFYAYSAYWSRATERPGEVVVVVVAESVLVNFECFLTYGNQRVAGKFRFLRMQVDSHKTGFLCYNFFCQAPEIGGEEQPKEVGFVDLSTKNKLNYTLKLRELSSRTTPGRPKSLLSTLCVDLYSERSQTDRPQQETSMLQFFTHHSILGVTDFVIYNGDEMSQKLLTHLHSLKIQIHLLPFNFPFSAANVAGLRAVILNDCLLRTHGVNSQYLTVLNANEFLYMDSRKSDLFEFPARVVKLQLTTLTVCTDPAKKLLMDNFYYDAEAKNAPEIILHRQYLPTYSANAETPLASRDAAIALRYISGCAKIGSDGLRDWRSSMREEFMRYIREIRQKLLLLL